MCVYPRMIVPILEHLQIKRDVENTLEWWLKGRAEGQTDRGENRKTEENSNRPHMGKRP